MLAVNFKDAACRIKLSLTTVESLTVGLVTVCRVKFAGETLTGVSASAPEPNQLNS